MTETPKPERREGRGESFLARVIGEGESPAWWGIPVASIAGCRVRVHLVTPVYVLAALAHALWNDLGVPFVLMGLGALGAVVILHELVRGHALVRWGRLHPIDVTLWPLGAVWRFQDEHPAREEARAALTALAAVAGLCAILAGLVFAYAPEGARLLTDFFRPALALGGLSLAMGALWQAYAMTAYVVLANLLPMLPLDGALVLRGLARSRPGPDRAAAIGVATAAGLVVFGMVTKLTPIALLGMCGAVVCWFEWQSSRFRVDPAGVDRWREALHEPETERETRGGAGPISDEDREGVERVLAKISAEGIDSLTRAERRLLHDATERLRGG